MEFDEVKVQNPLFQNGQVCFIEINQFLNLLRMVKICLKYTRENGKLTAAHIIS
jgi:hypothetical protein